jgi:hypothetical protein
MNAALVLGFLGFLGFLGCLLGFLGFLVHSHGATMLDTSNQ